LANTQKFSRFIALTAGPARPNSHCGSEWLCKGVFWNFPEKGIEARYGRLQARKLLPKPPKESTISSRPAEDLKAFRKPFYV
jgi:hypothetical protein